MSPRILLFVVAATMAASVAAQTGVPAPLPPPPLPADGSASRSPTAPPPDDCDRCGTIQSIQRVTAKETWAPLGTVSSTSVGAGDITGSPPVTMYEIGKGFSKKGTVMVGAAGGAAYGARPKELNAPRWEVTIKMDAGGMRAVSQNYEPMLREGDRDRADRLPHW